jgi:hypothetical protein
MAVIVAISVCVVSKQSMFTLESTAQVVNASNVVLDPAFGNISCLS